MRDATGSTATTSERADPDERFRSFLLAVGLALTAYVVGNLVLAAVAAVLEAAGVPVLDDPGLLVLLGTFAIQGVGYVGVVAVFLERTDRWHLPRVRRPTLRDGALVVGGFVVLLVAQYGIALAVGALGVDLATSDIVETGLGDPRLLLVLAGLSVLVVGPAEELLYRGVIQTSLTGTYGTVGAVVLTSAVFAPIHVFGLTGSTPAVLATLVTIFSLSLVLGALYERSDTLVVPALVHGVYNATQFLVAYASTTGLV
ncbi:CPBP family intramembrane glutamic endopeptidase [Halomarina ordinaria]|uniref:CPBP family intramembrane glutamic endopeptidase n=1 Tax=Halomarina ordinaria TaxID=3033939 RepID=A0ABD5UG12_9EURY|nr:CPBP family intramembrane glutamic endopeptidase [Halomarina sp. PSRA2]